MIVDKGSFTLRNETIWHQTHGSLITFNNGLEGPSRQNPHPTPSLEPPPDFVLRCPNPRLKK